MAIPNLPLLSEQWEIADPDLGIGPSLSGSVQAIAGPTPRWAAQFTFRVALIHSTAWLEWEAWRAARRGRLVAEDIVPRAARMLTGWEPGVAFDGGVLFEGAIAFESGDGFGETIEAGAAAAQYATSVPIVPGHASVPIGRFVWIGGVMHRVTSAAAGSINVQPPLRAAVAQGDAIETEGTVRMNLASSSEGVLTITGAAHQRVTIGLIEE